jgi:hypothetical protein
LAPHELVSEPVVWPTMDVTRPSGSAHQYGDGVPDGVTDGDGVLELDADAEGEDVDVRLGVCDRERLRVRDDVGLKLEGDAVCSAREEAEGAKRAGRSAS